MLVYRLSPFALTTFLFASKYRQRNYAAISELQPSMSFQFDNTYAKLPEAFFASAIPTPVSAPTMIRWNRDLAAELQIDVDLLDSEEGLGILSGNRTADGAQPLAMAYSGHQFGGFSPQLGDGRAILLGEVLRNDGVRHDIQLKGAGQTPFSRRGDGRSALGPVLREYIVSEAMAALGVPTTRSLAAVTTGDNVVRDGLQAGGVLTRVAQSHIRIGTFQWFAARRDDDNLKVLADYVIERHFPDAATEEHAYLALLEAVIERQANLIAHWMQLGFIHGVMNTDNMSISGETIDYGPCAFMDTFHPNKKFSSIDHQGRYAFSNQAPIGLWNLSRFAETLLPLLAEDQKRAITLAEEALEKYPDLHQSALTDRFTAKIGITASDDNSWNLVQKLLTAMENGKADFTLVFRHLSSALETDDDCALISQFEQADEIVTWLSEWRQSIPESKREEAMALMRRTNPVYIPRNHRVEEAISAGYTGDFAPFHRLVDVLKQPFDSNPQYAEFEAAPSAEEVVHATFCGT